MKIFVEIALSVNFLDHTQMTRIIKKIVNNFDYKWVGVLFHQSDFLENCLMLFLVQEFHRCHRPFDCENFLIMLSCRSENMCEATLSDKVVLVRLIGVSLIALLGNTK
jgi:hypothetical protein